MQKVCCRSIEDTVAKTTGLLRLISPRPGTRVPVYVPQDGSGDGGPKPQSNLILDCHVVSLTAAPAPHFCIIFVKRYFSLGYYCLAVVAIVATITTTAITTKKATTMTTATTVLFKACAEHCMHANISGSVQNQFGLRLCGVR